MQTCCQHVLWNLKTKHTVRDLKAPPTVFSPAVSISFISYLQLSSTTHSKIIRSSLHDLYLTAPPSLPANHGSSSQPLHLMDQNSLIQQMNEWMKELLISHGDSFWFEETLSGSENHLQPLSQTHECLTKAPTLWCWRWMQDVKRLQGTLGNAALWCTKHQTAADPGHVAPPDSSGCVWWQVWDQRIKLQTVWGEAEAGCCAPGRWYWRSAGHRHILLLHAGNHSHSPTLDWPERTACSLRVAPHRVSVRRS